MAKRIRIYRSCYSCDHSKIFYNGKEKLVECGLSNRITRLKSGMAYPDWCPLIGIKEDKDESIRSI